MTELELWKQNANQVLQKEAMRDAILKPFFGVLEFVHEVDWQGACHAITGILFVLFREKNVPAEMIIGEAQGDSIVFDHSWIEIDGQVYDAAITKTLIAGYSFPPVLKGADLRTKQVSTIRYGVKSGHAADEHAQMILSTAFGAYMDNFDGYKRGLWGLTREIAERSGLYINVGRIRDKYYHSQWNQKSD